MRSNTDDLVLLQWVRMILIAGLVLLAPWSVATSQGTHDSPPPSAIGYSNAVLGFRYTPPTGLQDKTERTGADIEARAQSLHNPNTLHLLLTMSADTDDAARDWRLLSIETYSRKALADLDDASAEARMSAWVARSKDVDAVPRSVVLSGQSFSVSIFKMRKGRTKKGAVVFTTIRKSEILSFAFVANSAEQLKKLTESMKSVQFF